MADDESSRPLGDPGQPAPAAPPPAAPPPAAPDPAGGERVAALERQLHELNGRNKQYETVLTNIVQAQQAAQQGPVPTVVSPQARAYLRSRGQSDEEIDANAGLIGPYLDYAAQVAINPLMEQNRTLQHRLDQLQAQTEYEDWDVVKPTVDKLAEEARQRGEQIDLRTLYDHAVVQNFDRVAEARAARRAAATMRAQDASALSSVGGSRAVSVGDGGPMTAEKFLRLPAEERAKIPHTERLKLWNELE